MNASFFVQAVTWVATALHAWLPATDAATVDRAAQHVVTVAYDPLEPVLAAPRPLYGEMADRAFMALLIARTAAEESALRSDIQDGHCLPTECDHGHATCWMQVHVYRGVELTAGGFRFATDIDIRSESRRFTAASLLTQENELDCVRVGYHMVLQSFRSSGSLRLYTGERADHAPIAKRRLKTVVQYIVDNPPPSLPEAA
jgi:hypothetical protein